MNPAREARPLALTAPIHAGSVGRPLLWVGAVLALGGCVIMDDSVGKDTGGPPQAETVTWSPETDDTAVQNPLPSVSVTWGDEALQVEVSELGTWQLGMAETGGSCGGSVSCWTGEDCFQGFTAADGTSVGPYCHTMGGAALDLTYGGDIFALEPGTTVFQPAFANTVTFLLQPSDPSLPCLVFGDDPSYYASLGCFSLSL